jgi:cytochrome c
MKRRQSTEPDLFVISKKLTDKEAKEISDFIKNYKRKQTSNKQKNNKKLLKPAEIE